MSTLEKTKTCSEDKKRQIKKTIINKNVKYDFFQKILSHRFSIKQVTLF